MPWPLLIALVVGAPPPPERTLVRSGRYDPPPTAVLSRERLGETAGGDLAAALDGEPGLTIGRLGGLGAFATLAIRGSTPEQVLVVLDGIPLNPADGAPVDLSTLPVGPLDAVEVYRGRTPWSLGVTGLGGALVMHSRAPRDAGADAELVLGAFETGALRTWVGAPVELGAHTLGLSLALDGLHTASDFRFDNDGGTAWTGADDRTETRRNAGSDQLSVLGRADLALGDARLTLVDLYTVIGRGIPSLGVTPTTKSRFALTRNLLALHLDAPAGPLVVAATLWLAASGTDVRDPLGEIGLGSGRSTVASLVPGVALTLRAPLSPSQRLRLVPSLHLAWRSETTDRTAAPTDARGVASLAAELALKHDSGLELGTGVRVETDFDAVPLGAFLEGALALDDLRLTLAARLCPRLPSLFELHGDTGFALGNPDLRPESSTTVELGARWEPPLSDDGDKPLALAAFAYATWAADLIQFIQNSQGVSRPENLGAARILGLELAAEATFRHLYLRSSLTLLDATDTSDIAARNGNQLPLRPALSTSHRVELRLPDRELGPTHGGLGVYVELDHVAGNHLDFANLVAVPARTLLGAGAFVRSDVATVTLSVSNVLSDAVQDLAGYPLPGLTAMLSLRLESSPR